MNMQDALIWLWLLLAGLALAACQVQTATAPDKTALPAENGADATAVDATAVPLTATMANDTTEANADVLFVKATETVPGVWTFAVTVAHPDTGWDDYADGWNVVMLDGQVARPDPDAPFTRLLLHPHENEQPFTRSQSNIEIPAGVEIVTVRAHDLVHGFGGREVRVDLTTAVATNDYEVIRYQE